MEGNVLEISPCSQLTQLHSRPQPPGRSPLRGREDPPHPAVGLRSSGGMAGDDRRSPPGHGRPLPGLGGAAAARDGLREAAVRGPAARGACRASRCEALRRAGPPGESLICLPVLGMSKPLLFMIKKNNQTNTVNSCSSILPVPITVVSGWWTTSSSLFSLRHNSSHIHSGTESDRSQLPMCGSPSLLVCRGTAGGEYPPKLHRAELKWCWKALPNPPWQLSHFTFLGLLCTCSGFYPSLPGLQQPGKDS